MLRLAVVAADCCRERRRVQRVQREAMSMKWEWYRRDFGVAVNSRRCFRAEVTKAEVRSKQASYEQQPPSNLLLYHKQHY